MENKNGLRYEYEQKELLKDNETKYIGIPLSVITNTNLDTKRVAILSYLRIYCGLNNIVNFTVPNMVEWCGGKPNRRVGKNNDKFLNVVNALSDLEYLQFLTQQSISSFVQCSFNMEYYNQECCNGYSVLYLDEIEKIINYKNNQVKNNILINPVILLVFAYFRNKIIRRPNELKPEERSVEKIKERRRRCPEAYDNNINKIASEIGITVPSLTKIIDILEYDLKLIVTDRAYRIKNKDGEFRTPPTIFANAYKREDKYLLAVGEEYSRTEIKLKAEKLYNYKINKNKRKKNMKGQGVGE